MEISEFSLQNHTSQKTPKFVTMVVAQQIGPEFKPQYQQKQNSPKLRQSLQATKSCI
jgi:hypothetical protein